MANNENDQEYQEYVQWARSKMAAAQGQALQAAKPQPLHPAENQDIAKLEQAPDVVNSYQATMDNVPASETQDVDQRGLKSLILGGSAIAGAPNAPAAAKAAAPYAAAGLKKLIGGALIGAGIKSGMGNLFK